MTSVSIYDPGFSNLYEESNIINTLANIAALSIAAYYSSNSPNNLIIGASSNIIFQAKQGVDVFINSNESFTIYTTTSSGCNATPIFGIQLSNNQTILTSCNFKLDLAGTTAIGNAVLYNSNNYQLFSTSNALGFVMGNDVTMQSNLIVNDNLSVYKNIACAGNVFGHTMNIFNTTPNTTATSNLVRVGYSFHVNGYNQLELLRTDQLNSNSTLISRIQRIMTFGNTEFNNQLKDNPDNYNVMRQFTNVSGNYSNGSTPGMTEVKWTPQIGTSNIYYSYGYVGVGTTNPISRLHVAGNLTLEGHLIPRTNVTYDLGTPSNRFRDLYLSGNTINLADSMITIDDNGNFTFLTSNGTPATVAGWSTNGANIYIIQSNVGIHTSTPQYPLEVNGAFSALGYCNLLVDSYTSTSQFTAPTSSNLTFVYQTLCNITKSTSNVAFNAQTLAITVSNYAYGLSNLSVGAVLSNAAFFGSNTSVALSNYVYTNNTIDLTALSNIAYTACNKSVFASNVGIYASNTAFDSSNASVWASNTSISASNTANYATNVGISASNKAAFTSNITISLSNYVHSNVNVTATFASNLGITMSNYVYTMSNVSNDPVFSSNTAVFSSNLTVTVSNYVFTPSNSAVQANVTAVFSSNHTIVLSNHIYAKAIDTSNYVYGDITSNVNVSLSSAIFASNYITNFSIDPFASNAASYASNNIASMSNYLYAISNVAADMYSSNTSTFASNLSVSTSNIIYPFASNTDTLLTSLSNYVYTSNLIIQNTAIYASNESITAYITATYSCNIAISNQIINLFASNASVFASNTHTEMSNFVYPISVFSSNTASSACNIALNSSTTALYSCNQFINLSNYAYSLSNGAISAFASNSSVFASNMSVATSNYAYSLSNGEVNAFASNLSVSTSNYAYPLSIYNSNTASYASNQNFITYNTALYSCNLGYSNMVANTFSSNTAVFSSNETISLSNYIYTSSQSVFASNTATYASNLSSSNFSSITSNNIYTSNLGVFASNCAVFSSNNIVTLSNSVYTTFNSQITSNFIYNSNLGGFASNSVTTVNATAAFASNTVITLSNFVYSTSDYAFASNTAVFASNTATVSSNAVANVALIAIDTSNALNNLGTIAVYASNTSMYLLNSPYPQAAQEYEISTSGFAYTITGYSNTNPNIQVIPGITYAFKLSTPGHPFQVRLSNGGTAVTDGMTWVDGSNIAMGASANSGRQNGTLFWKVPSNWTTSIVYQCQFHSSMIGNINPLGIHDTSNVANYASNLAVVASNQAFSIQFNDTSSTLSNLTYSYVLPTLMDTSNIAYNTFTISSGASNLSYSAYNLAIDAVTIASDASNIAYNAETLTNEMSNIAYNTESLTFQMSNIAYTAYDLVTDIIDSQAWIAVNNSTVYTMSTVGIGKSNPSYTLDVAGTVNANNISTKTSSGTITITNSPSTMFTLSSSNQAEFYTLYLGPTLTGVANYVYAMVFWNTQTNSAYVNTVSSNADITIATSGGQVNVSGSLAISGLTYKWSLYKM